MTDECTLYIIMRADLQDMNPGKAMAQAAHAQADFDSFITSNKNSVLKQYYDDWKDTRNFGRTIVLYAPYNVWYGSKIKDVVDPTYPWRNYYGEIFTTNEVTCGWFFETPISDEYTMNLIKTFPLHK